MLNQANPLTPVVRAKDSALVEVEATLRNIQLVGYLLTQLPPPEKLDTPYDGFRLDHAVGYLLRDLADLGLAKSEEGQSFEVGASAIPA